MKPGDPRHWQRLAPISLVFLIANSIQKLVRENLYAFAGAGAGFAFIDRLGLRELLLGALALLLIICVGAMINYRRFRYRLEDDAVRVRSGLWIRKELRIRFARIQNIQISHPFYFRPFGLVRFSLETPGAAEKEVELPGIPRATAELIRDRIAEQLNGPDLPQDDETTSADVPELYSPGTGRLFAHGMASNQIWVMAGAAAYLYSVFRERIGTFLQDRLPIDWLVEQALSAWYLAPILLLAAILLLQSLSGLLSIVRFYGYRLVDQDDRVVASSGLLDRREQTVRRKKITGLVLQQSMMGRLLGCWYLMVRQASSNEMDMEGHKKQLLVPGMRRGDFALTRFLVPRAGEPPVLNAISPGFRRIFWIRLFLLMTAGMGVLVWLMGFGHWSVLLGGAAMLVVLGAIHLRWRQWGWALEGDMLWVRQGLLGQRFDVFSLELVQQARLGQSPYQFRRDLANLQLTLPQGSVTIPFLAWDVAAELANRAIYAAETALTHRV